MSNEELARQVAELRAQVAHLTNMVCEVRDQARGSRDRAMSDDATRGPGGQYGESQQSYFGVWRG
jgi:hypothetical protein